MNETRHESSLFLLNFSLNFTEFLRDDPKDPKNPNDIFNYISTEEIRLLDTNSTNMKYEQSASGKELINNCIRKNSCGSSFSYGYSPNEINNDSHFFITKKPEKYKLFLTSHSNLLTLLRFFNLEIQ